ncbi:MAG: hypothetical protein ACYTEQ_09215 [Planctomycetota bacterium]
MAKKGIFLTAVILLSVAGLARAQPRELHGYVDLAYQSRFVWRGFSVFGSQGQIQPTLDLDLYGTGIGLNIMGHWATHGGYVNSERIDYTAYYYNALFQEERYATDYKLAYRYYNYPDNPTQGSATAPNANLQEINALLSWPNITGIEGLVPRYSIICMWPSGRNSFSGSRSSLAYPPGLAGKASGWIHILMLDYTMPVPGLLPDTPEQPVRLHTEIAYNGGVGWAGQRVDNDWSHILFGIDTDFDLGYNLTFTPGLYQQVTLDRSVNSEKYQVWASLGVRYTF